MAKLGFPNLSQSPDIEQNSEEGISDFQISCQFLIKENCYTFRTSREIDMKLGPIPKLDKRNKMSSKKIYYDVMLANYDVIVIFPIYGQIGAIFAIIRKPNSGPIV